MISSDDASQKRSIIRATKHQQEVLRAAYEANGLEPFSPEHRQRLSLQLNLPTNWLSNWCGREKKRLREKDSPAIEILQFKLETDDTVIPPPTKKKKRTHKKDLASESSASTDPFSKPQDSYPSDTNTAIVPSHQSLLYSSGTQQVYREPYPVSMLQSSIPLPNSYNMNPALEPLQTTNPSVYRPISLPSNAYNSASDLSDASIAHLMSQAALLKYLPVLQDPTVTDSLLDERLVQRDPFQAAIGLVYLSRRGSRW
ncbi:hypothetical protein CPB85DRAFT_1557870 [Mucidula mucida]|nr:hypothetical protein CPB85DRAFT_1557870 [Mucidula mucida]